MQHAKGTPWHSIHALDTPVARWLCSAVACSHFLWESKRQARTPPATQWREGKARVSKSHAVPSPVSPWLTQGWEYSEDWDSAATLPPLTPRRASGIQET